LNRMNSHSVKTLMGYDVYKLYLSVPQKKGIYGKEGNSKRLRKELEISIFS